MYQVEDMTHIPVQQIRTYYVESVGMMQVEEYLSRIVMHQEVYVHEDSVPLGYVKRNVFRESQVRMLLGLLG